MFDKIFVSDTENCPTNKENSATRVYATGLMDINTDEMIYHNSLEKYFDFLFSLDNDNILILFHNLSYDITFILNFLVNKLGFKQIINEYEEKDNMNVKIKKKKSEIPFNSYEVVYANGSFYQVTLYIGENIKFNPKSKSKKKEYNKQYLKTITFRDTYKIVAKSLKQIAKDFLGVEMSKQGLDYNLIREENYVLNEEEMKYLYEDIKYLKDFVNLIYNEGIQVNNKFKIKFEKMTIASQSLDVYKKFLASDYLRLDENIIKILNNCDINKFKYLLFNKYKIENKTDEQILKILPNIIFEIIFPKIRIEQDTFIRKSYYGGITYKNSELVDSLEGDICGLVYDVNSLYPSVMRTRLLPYGFPLYYKGDYKITNINKKEYPLYIQKIRVKKFELKEGFIPNIQIKDNTNFKANDYQYNNKDNNGNYIPLTFTFTNVQLDYFLKSYNVEDIEYIEGYAFKGAYNLFNTYIDTFMEMKKNGEGAVKETAKLFLNSLYGKFGMNPNKEERILNFDNEIFSTSNLDENGNTLEFISDSIYLPMATFITAYAREILLTTIEKVYERFLYCDTDSIHITGYDIPNIEIHDKNLGAWKCEGKFVNAKYIGAKRYAELMVNEKDNTKKWVIKCCGLSKDIMEKLDIEVFDICQYSSQEVKKLIDTFYKKDNDIYYYYDKECTKKVKGLVRSKKKKAVCGGLLILEQPYLINDRYLLKY